eukprot:4602887-Amphidinium_carterae.1
MSAAAALQHQSDEMAKRTQALLNANKRPLPASSSTSRQASSQPPESKRKLKAQQWFLNRKDKRMRGNQRPQGNFH